MSLIDHQNTPAYCSPEQAQGQPLSRKADIWSWGVSVLEMFVGAVTWMHGMLAREALATHQAEEPSIPSMPADLVTLLARCFQPHPQDRPTTMLALANELQAIYTREMGCFYPRVIPSAVQLQANTLNNRALSLSDLGKKEEAMQAWDQALQADPQHLETIYNRGVTLWRQNGSTDTKLLNQLEMAHAIHSQPWQVPYLQALVHLERGDTDSAMSILREATLRAPGATNRQPKLPANWASATAHAICGRSNWRRKGRTRSLGRDIKARRKKKYVV